MEIYSKEGPSTWYKIRSGYQYRGSKEQVRERFGRDGPRRNSKIPFCILFCWLGDLMETESTCSVPYGWAWERQIQLIPFVLSSLMREYGHTLDDESFRTLLTKVECILNSQPLSTPRVIPVIRIHSLQATCWLWSPGLLCLHQVIFRRLMFAFEGDGNAFSIFRRSSGRGGERSLYKIYSREWNETAQGGTLLR